MDLSADQTSLIYIHSVFYIKNTIKGNLSSYPPELYEVECFLWADIQAALFIVYRFLKNEFMAAQFCLDSDSH